MILETLAYFLVRCFSWGLNRVGDTLAEGIGKLLGLFIYLFSSRKKVVYADLKAALGSRFSEKEREKVVWEHSMHLGLMAVEILRFPSVEEKYVERFVRIPTQEQYDLSFVKGKGEIYLAAHFGNWELLQIAFGVWKNPLFVLARKQKMSRLNNFLNQLRETHGSTALQRGMGVRELLRALRRGRFVGILGDQGAGKYEGEILPFLGRKTTFPNGAFEIAARTGAPVCPTFLVRKKGFCQELHMMERILIPQGTPSNQLEPYRMRYVKMVEDFILAHPSQWLWEVKRWKYSWTKRILILSDGKKGHEKQSEAVAERFKNIKAQYGRPGLEFPTSKINVEYRSEAHKLLFQIVSFFFWPFVQGRIRFLRFFFTPETFPSILNASADFILSAGTSLVPLNLCLARDSRAKSIVLMKPSFPFNLFRFDLAIVPAHDEGLVPANALRMLLTPNPVSEGELKEAGSKMAEELKDISRIRFSFFIGGATRQFRLPLEAVQNLFSEFEKRGSRFGDCLITTSRRTPQNVLNYLKREVASRPYCQLLVNPQEDPRPEIVGAMRALAEVLIVTEDSISMISEAVSSGKKVLVLKFPDQQLPAKHKRFQELLASKSLVSLATSRDFSENLESLMRTKPNLNLHAEQEALERRLQQIL